MIVCCKLHGAPILGSMELIGLVPVCIMAGVAGGYATTHVQATGVAIVPIIFIFNAFYALALTPLPMLYGKTAFDYIRFFDSRLTLLCP